MSAWKSPLLFFGIFVILLAGAALVAPYFINWGSYRAEFEKYGRQITGRETKVAGDISVRLFPWPRMLVKDVRVANPPGAMVKELFRADEIDVRLRLAPLLSGKLEVEGIDVNRPVFGLERLASGRGSWVLAPETGLNKVFGAENIALSGVSITNGTVVLADGRRGGEAQLDGFNAFVSARSMNGPWKLRGEAVVNDQGVTISLNTGKWRENQPLKFGVRLSSNESTGLVYAFDGQSGVGESHEITGNLKVSPAAGKKRKSDAKANFRPMVFRSKVKANFEEVKFTEIEVAPKNAVDVRTFVTGQARVKLGSLLNIDAKLQAARFDADLVLGNKGRKTLRSAASLQAIATLVDQLPKNVRVHTKIDVTTLVLAGEPIDGASIDFSVAESALNINHLSVALPGQTKATFKGGILAGGKTGVAGEAGGGQQPQLIGDLTLDMISLKDFTKWLGHAYRREIEKKWSGARGRFKLAAKIDLSAQHVRLKDGDFSLDDANGKLGFSLTHGKQPAVSVELSGSEIDVDRYAPEGLLEEAQKSDLTGFFIDNLSQMVGERDISLRIETDTLKMNGVEARDVAFEFNASENAVDFRQLKIGSVGDARVDMSGVVKFADEAVTGSVEGKISANNPAKLLRLVGIANKNDKWLTAVSPLALRISGQANDKDKQTNVKVFLNGKAGQALFSGNARFAGTVDRFDDGNIHLSGQLSGKSAKGLLAIFAIDAPMGTDGPGKVALTATGKLKDGLAATADLEGFGVNSQFSGTITKAQKPGVGAGFDLSNMMAKGRLAALIENTDQLFGVLGMHKGEASPIGKVFSGEGLIAIDGQKLNLQDIKGTVAGTSFKGSLGLRFDQALPVLALDLQSGRLSLSFVLGTSLLTRNGNRQTAATRFSPATLAAVKSNIRLSAEQLELWPGFNVKNGRVVLAAGDGLAKLSVAGTSAVGQPVDLSLDARVGEQITRVSGKIKGASALSRLLKTNAGDEVLGGVVALTGEFGGSGRTPGGLFASLSGKGAYRISDGVVAHVSPATFAEKLPVAETAKDIETMIAADLRAGDMKFGDGSGTFVIENGVASFAPLQIRGPGARGALRVVYEIANGLTDVSVQLQLDKPEKVPGFEIAYAGRPGHLASSSDFAALKSNLTVAALNRTLDKLEALEEEQRRLVEEEKKARAEAEAKRRAQQEKQRILRERQRKLLEEATKKKQQDAAKKAAEEKAPIKLPRVIVPTPKPRQPLVVNPETPAPIQAPVTRKTVLPEVIVRDVPPVKTENTQPSFPPVQPLPLQPKQPSTTGNWRTGTEIEGGR